MSFIKTKESFITTNDVPPQHLEGAFLVGHIPQTALQSDPRVSYTLYIPPQPYKSLCSSPKTQKLPLLVNIHGTRRNLSAMYTSLSAFANSTCCAILCPLFPAGIEGPNDLHSYKKLRSNTLQSDVALLNMLDEVATRWPCISTQKVFMMGFSGGGQFVQRFLYIYPERLMAVSIGAPGKVTLLDEGQKWPKGVKDTMSVFQRSVHVQAIKAVDIHLVVGSEDTSVHGGNEFKVWQESIKTKLENNEHTAAVTSNIGESKGGGDGRLGTLQNLQKTWEHVGIHAHLDLVQGVAHSADGVRKCVLDHLGPLLREFNDGESTDSTLS